MTFSGLPLQIQKLPLIKPFHLHYTLKCGQVFGWKFFFGGYLGFPGDFPAHLVQEEDTLRVTATAGAFAAWGGEGIARYFRWDDPLEGIALEWKGDPILQEAFRTFPGLRLIRQEPWPCMVSFLLSSCSNIPKIDSTLEKLSHHAGTPARLLGVHLAAVPNAKRIAGLREATLRRFGMGYRAPYLRASARKVARGFPLESLRALPYPEARKTLLTFPGIGEKVADCILLYGCDQLESFPVDVWMKRIVEHFYFRGWKKTPRYIADWGRERFGKHAGYAQQYLYTYGRWRLDPQSPFRNGAATRLQTAPPGAGRPPASEQIQAPSPTPAHLPFSAATPRALSP